MPASAARSHCRPPPPDGLRAFAPGVLAERLPRSTHPTNVRLRRAMGYACLAPAFLRADEVFEVRRYDADVGA